MSTETETNAISVVKKSDCRPQIKLEENNESTTQAIDLHDSHQSEKCGDVAMVDIMDAAIVKTGSSQTSVEYRDQGDIKITIDKKYPTETSSDTPNIQYSYSTSAILVPVISATSGRNILEEMKRRVANTFTSRQNTTNSSLVPGTNVEYKTPGANNKNKNGRIKRPMNAFMVWAREYRSYLATSMPHATNSEISVKLGQIWASMKADDKRTYYDIAEKIKTKHRKDYPGWVYQPSTPGLKKREETLNYGRTPTPPPSFPLVSQVPVSSMGSVTQQTTLVVLSNDNKIHHTPMTSSTKNTTDGMSTFLETLSVPTKVVPCNQTTYNQEIVPPKTQDDKSTDQSLSENRSLAEKICNNGCNASTNSSNLMKIGDPAQVQYQSAMEIPRANEVSNNTKDLLAMKISSARSSAPPANDVKQKTPSTNSASIKHSNKTITKDEWQPNISETTYWNNYVQKTVLSASPKTIESSEQLCYTAGNTTSTAEQNTKVKPSHNRYEPQTNSDVHLKRSDFEINQKTKYDVKNKNTPKVSTHTVTAGNLRNIFHSISGIKYQQLSHKNINSNSHVFNREQSTIQQPRIISRQQSRQTPVFTNVRPPFSRAIMNIAPNNLIRFELPKIRPSGTNFPKPDILTTENIRIKPKHPLTRPETVQECFNLNNNIIDTELNTDLDNQSDTTDKPKPNDVTQHDKYIETIPYPCIEEKDKKHVDLSCLQHRLHDMTQLISRDCLDQQDDHTKQADRLWPFPFSDNPADWDNEDNEKYVELIDPYDPFLTPDDFMSEMYPGTLHLDIERWRQYMSAKPNMEYENLEKYFHDSSDDITISPVPLRETLKRLVNIRKQESDMCDVISGDLLVDKNEKNADNVDNVEIVLDDIPTVLTDEMAKTLSDVMGSIMANNEDDIPEDTFVKIGMNQDIIKSHLDDQTGDVTYDILREPGLQKCEAYETVNGDINIIASSSESKIENVDHSTIVERSESEVVDCKPFISGAQDTQSMNNESKDYTKKNDILILEKTDTQKYDNTLAQAKDLPETDRQTFVPASKQAGKISKDTPRPRRSTRCKSRTKERS
ncbi:Transcription factor SOX-30 [Mactra antiquata]